MEELRLTIFNFIHNVGHGPKTLATDRHEQRCNSASKTSSLTYKLRLRIRRIIILLHELTLLPCLFFDSRVELVARFGNIPSPFSRMKVGG